MSTGLKSFPDSMLGECHRGRLPAGGAAMDNDWRHRMTRPYEELLDRVIRFREERDWARFHHPKDLAISITLEAAEFLELFQWKDRDEIREMLLRPEYLGAAGEELADILILVLSASDALGIDLYDAVLRKIRKNAEKYPVEKARGNATKYDKL